MKKKTTLILTLGILVSSLFGNSGTYLSRGGMIYPIKESNISIDKEILSFKVIDNICYVNIQFEFNNLDSIERKLLIGFQAPTASGDVSDSICNICHISNFRIIKGGKIIPYKLKVAKCEDCDLKDPSELHFSQSDYGVFVYLFAVTFQPGINKINHSYSFPASRDVDFNQIYKYILTTGAKWAGGTIKDLTIQIDMGKNKYFFVSDVFGDHAKWSVIGAGKVTNDILDFFFDKKNRMVRIISGFLQIEVKNLNPTKNIVFGIINKYSFVRMPCYFMGMGSDSIVSIGNIEFYGDKEYTEYELLIMRNTIYAQYGYYFKNAELFKYFNQFEWYMPDPNLTAYQIEMTNREKIFISEIVKREKKYKE